MHTPSTLTWAIRPLVPKEVYTDRDEHLEYLYQSALKAIVFQIKILSALSVGDIRQYDLLPLAFSKSLSEKLYHPAQHVHCDAGAAAHGQN